MSCILVELPTTYAWSTKALPPCGEMPFVSFDDGLHDHCPSLKVAEEGLAEDGGEGSNPGRGGGTNAAMTESSRV